MTYYISDKLCSEVDLTFQRKNDFQYYLVVFDFLVRVRNNLSLHRNDSRTGSWMDKLISWLHFSSIKNDIQPLRTKPFVQSVIVCQIWPRPLLLLSRVVLEGSVRPREAPAAGNSLPWLNFGCFYSIDVVEICHCGYTFIMSSNR